LTAAGRSRGRAKGGLSHRFFRLAVFVKGADGVLETIGGVLLAIFGAKGVNRIIALVTQHELSQDPSDPIPQWFLKHGSHLGITSVRFAVLYLILHGVFKMLLAVGLIIEKRWVFPVALVSLGAFLVYEGYRLTHRPSVPIGLACAFDLLVLGLVWREYRSMPNAA
jgi:uncharacterized membrane protein